MTKIGFWAFLGIILGVLVGTQLPYPASYEAIFGGSLALVLGYIIEHKSKKK